MTKAKYSGDDVFQMLCKVMDQSLSETIDPDHAANVVGAGKAIADMMKHQLKANELAQKAKEVGLQLRDDALDHYGGKIIDAAAPIAGPYPGMVRQTIIQQTAPQPIAPNSGSPEFEPQEDPKPE